MRVVRREKSPTRKRYGTYDPLKFCDWITHLDYYFDLYKFFDERRFKFAKGKLKVLALYYWTAIDN